MIDNAAMATAQPAALDYTAPEGVTFTVTAEGISRICLGERMVAQGGWYAWNAGPAWFGRGDKTLVAYSFYAPEIYRKARTEISTKTLAVLAPNHARVTHRQPSVTTTYDYEFAGEDVTISARVENNHPEAELTVPAFGGLRFSFQREPGGNPLIWHPSYLKAQQSNVFHPSLLNKIGGSYASDDRVGVGLSPLRTGLAHTLFQWDWDAWNPTTPERKANRWLTYLRYEPIPAGGARTFRMNMRVSGNRDWRHLLEPYKEHFLATFGPLRYQTDFRAVGAAYVNRNLKAIAPSNPYGFFEGARRLDLPEGVAKFCETVIPGLKTMNAQGLILWGHSGESPRGQMYRADFDVLPPEVEKQWTALRTSFDQAGLRLGVCTRPRHFHVRADWTHDVTFDINPGDPQHLEGMLWPRYKKMIDLGCTLFYLDSFGCSLEDVKTMQFLRARMGPVIGTYTEHACDAMAPYSGFYSETDFWAKGFAEGRTEDGWVPRTNLKFHEIVRWMLGPVPVITRQYDVHGKVPAGFEPVASFAYRNHLSPIIPDYQINNQTAAIAGLQAEYLDGKGSWKK